MSPQNAIFANFKGTSPRLGWTDKFMRLILVHSMGGTTTRPNIGFLRQPWLFLGRSSGGRGGGGARGGSGGGGGGKGRKMSKLRWRHLGQE